MLHNNYLTLWKIQPSYLISKHIYVHYFLSQLLHLLKRSCPYIHISVPFLFTIARYSDTGYYKNMSKMMKYIQVTIGLTLILSINNSGNIKWYVDAAFALHKYMMSRTDGFMNMGTGASYVNSLKQKLNNKNST